MSEFDIELEHIAGVTNSQADFLSMNYEISKVDYLNINWETFYLAQKEDPFIIKLLNKKEAYEVPVSLFQLLVDRKRRVLIQKIELKGLNSKIYILLGHC